jgi:hypothetical protein
MRSTFVRSVSGLINFKRFVKRSFIVFCKGGSQNITVTDALGGQHNASAEDRTYWDALLRAIGFSDIHLKPLGSASHVIDVAEYIIANNISNNLVIIDRDFPGRKKWIADRRVLYSFGYSWENDVVGPKVVAEAIVNLLHLDPAGTSVLEKEFSDLLQRMIKISRWSILLQLMTQNPSCDFVPTDHSFGGCICGDAITVRFDSKPLYDRIQRNKSRFTRSGTRRSTRESARYIPGHALIGLGYAFIVTKAAVRPAYRPNRTSFSAMLLHVFSASPRTYLPRPTMEYYRAWARSI